MDTRILKMCGVWIIFFIDVSCIIDVLKVAYLALNPVKALRSQTTGHVTNLIRINYIIRYGLRLLSVFYALSEA
jgi:hypothetical protein